MEKYNVMTYEQAQAKMECYSEIFSEVRLLDEDMIMSLENGERPENLEGVCSCLISDDRDTICENCLPVRAYHEKKQFSKVELSSAGLYHVTAVYVEIDGKPYVMELVKYLDEDLDEESDEREFIEGKLNAYDKKLYTDVLTGAYNRRYFEDELRQRSISAGVALDVYKRQTLDSVPRDRL